MEDSHPPEDRATLDARGSRGAEIRRAVQEKYRAVSGDPEGKFPYPVGRKSALALGYDSRGLVAIPAEVVDHFVGVGNPFRLRAPRPGERVLDIGCGCGLDTFVAAVLAGPAGRAVGVDLTPAMLERPRRALSDWSHTAPEFVEGDAEDLPFADDSFDLVISNGVLNLVPDKDAAFAEIHRVLRPRGVFAAADLLVVASIPDEVPADMDAWST